MTPTLNLKIAKLALVLILFNSCSKENDVPDTMLNETKNIGIISTSSTEEIEQINQSMEKFAFDLAKKLTDVETRKVLKTEISKKFDGDNDVLWKDVKDKIQLYSSKNATTDILETNIKFQISMPKHLETWDETNFTPLVAIDPLGIDESETEFIKAFDSEGNIHYLDASSNPLNPVIVIGLNERVNEKGEIKYQESNISSTKTSGTYGMNVYLKMIKINNLSEPWYKGDAEICLSIAERREYDDDFRLGVDDSEELTELNELCFKKYVSQEYENSWLTVNQVVSYASFSQPSFDIYFWYEEDASVAYYPATVVYNGHTYYFYFLVGYDKLGYSATYGTTIINNTSYSNPAQYTTSTNDITYTEYGN